MTNRAYPPVSALKAGLGCRCPRCGKGRLFSGLLQVAESCERCGLHLKDHDSGDGPAVFVMFILGFVVVGLALFVELALAPPMWVHLLLWVPFIVLGAVLLLRPAKAIFIALQYKHKVHGYGDAG